MTVKRHFYHLSLLLCIAFAIVACSEKRPDTPSVGQEVPGTAACLTDGMRSQEATVL